VKQPVPSNWTIEDQIRLDATNPHEITLWKRFHRRFNDTPLNVLDGLTIETNHDKKLQDRNGNLTIENTNWSKGFCEALHHLICLPFFQDQPGLLRYAIKRAVYARMKEDYPDASEINPSRNKDFVDYLVKHIPGLDDDEEMRPFLLQTTTKFFGKGRPSHSRFLSHIEHAFKHQVKARGRHDTQELSGVTVADITTIIRAWDMYAQLRENKEELKTIEEYHEAAKGNRDGPSKDEILQLKKAWIIKSQSSSHAGTISEDGVESDPEEATEGQEQPRSSEGEVEQQQQRLSKEEDAASLQPRRVLSEKAPSPLPSRQPNKPGQSKDTSSTGSSDAPPPARPHASNNARPSADSFSPSGLSENPRPSGAILLPPPRRNKRTRPVPPAPVEPSIDVPPFDAWPDVPLDRPSPYDCISTPFDFHRQPNTLPRLKLEQDVKDDHREIPFSQNWHIKEEEEYGSIGISAESQFAGKISATNGNPPFKQPYYRTPNTYPVPLDGQEPEMKVKEPVWPSYQ
jgi:hypothetical protein